jgi:hypothetical protein
MALQQMKGGAKQDIHIHCLSLDRARSRDKQWVRCDAVNGIAALAATWRGPRQVALGEGWVVAVAGGSVRRRSRQAVSRPRVVQFSLTEEEFEEVSRAAERSGLARGAFAAEAALASARGVEARMFSPLREALAELIAAAGLVRRAGTNLNQAVAKLNATGQRGEDLLPAAQFCARVIRRLDDAAEQVRCSVP